MSNCWPLLVADPLSGERLITTQLRPRAGARPVDRADYRAAHAAVVDLCGTWGGAANPLLPVTPGRPIDDRWSRILLESNIDGIDDSELIDDDERRRFTDPEGPTPAQLIRVLVEVESRQVVSTCRDLSEDDPWHLAYLGALGDLSSVPHPQNTWNDLRADLTLDDVVTVRGIEGSGNAAGLLAVLRDFSAISALELSRTKLTTGLQGSLNMSFPATSRFQWDDDRVSQHFGPNIVVIYEPGSVEDLALIWNLRARFLHPRRMPLALPMSQNVGEDLQLLLRAGADHHFGFGYGLALTSFSVPLTDLEPLAAMSSHHAVVDPWQLLRPIGGYCVVSTEAAHFSRGKATIAAFSPTDLQTIGSSYLGRQYGSWMKRKAEIVDEPVPLSRTMRHAQWHGDAYYLRGAITSGGEPGRYATIRIPAGREVLIALGADRELEFVESAAGKAAEQLVRAAGPELSMLAAPGVAAALGELTRGRNVSLVRRRLNEFLADPALDEGSDRYQLLFDRLNRSLGVPDSEEVGYATFDRLRKLLRMTLTGAERWVDWALAGGLVLKGVEAKCNSCGHKQWRPLSETLPALACHGCGREIHNPGDLNQIGYRYRASEVLLRAMSHDVLPSVLAMRYLSSLLGGKSSVFGVYPGVEFREPGSVRTDAEADVLVVLRNGALLMGECKATARGLRDETLKDLWKAADRIGARATFMATLDRSANCSSDWRVQESPSGRPHFALTAEHLFDLQCAGPTLNQELFEWRADYGDGSVWPMDDDSNREARELSVDSEFSDYVERTGKDYEQHYRAPWMRSPED